MLNWKVMLIMLGTAITSTTLSVIADSYNQYTWGFSMAMVTALIGSAWAASVEWNEQQKKEALRLLSKKKEEEMRISEIKEQNSNLFDWVEWEQMAKEKLIEPIATVVFELIESLKKIKEQLYYLEMEEKYFFEEVLCKESYRMCLSYGNFDESEQIDKRDEMKNILGDIQNHSEELLFSIETKKNREFERQSRILRGKLRGE